MRVATSIGSGEIGDYWAEKAIYDVSTNHNYLLHFNIAPVKPSSISDQRPDGCSLRCLVR